MPDLAALAASLCETTANLDAYIDRYAQEQAAERVAEAQATANAAIREACAQTEQVRAELERERDLTAELRRRLAELGRRAEEARAARDRLSVALGHTHSLQSFAVLAAEAERRLAEDAATIERLRGQVLETTMTARMDEVRLAEHEEARDA